MNELKVDHVYREKAELFGGAIAGLHTMADKHFGISYRGVNRSRDCSHW